MMNWKAIVFGLTLAAIVPSAYAACWGIQYMPTGTWTYSAWLCNSSQVVGYWVNMYGQSGPFSMMLHGQIETVAPSGHPQYGNAYRVWLDNYQHVSPYPATLKCYKRMGVPGNYWWMYTGQQVTLYSGQYTGNNGPWVLAGCPPVTNNAQQGGSPPQVQIALSWSGYGGLMSGGGKTLATSNAMPVAKAKRARR